MNAEVSWSVPTLTQPGVGRHVVDAVREGFAELYVGEVVDVDLLWLPGRLVLPAAVLERPHELLLRGVDADHGLAGTGVPGAPWWSALLLEAVLQAPNGKKSPTSPWSERP